MYKIKLKNEEYLLPASWSEVTFAQLLALKKVKFQEGDGSVLSLALTIGAIMGCDHKELMKLPSADFVKLANLTKWVHTFDIKPEFKNEFEFDGVKYKLTPDFANLTAGEMASIEQYLIMGEEENTDKILSVLIREVDADGKLTEFDSNTVDSRADVLKKNLTIPLVNGISNFFLSGKLTSTETTQVYSEEIQIQDMNQKMEE
jgi:hypothetical protein